MIDCERWTSTNILWFCKCLCLRHWKHLCSWENLLRQLTFPSKILGNTHFKADVDEFFWSVSNQLEKFSMETIISGQWSRSQQSPACKGLCILRFCVFSSEPNIKFCWWTTVGLVQRFLTIRNFGHNWRRTDGIRVENFPASTTLQLVQEIQKFMNKVGEPEKFQGRIIFMSMFNDIIWWIKDNAKECIANSTFVTCKKIPKKWSLLGLGSEIKWYFAHNERPRRDLDRVAELMMIKFGESGHPVFRATSPLSRWTLKSKWGNLSRHFGADVVKIETVFRTLFL